LNESKISVRYARALFNLAIDKQVLEEVKNDISIIYQTFITVPEFKSFLSSPIIKTSDKRAVFNTTFGKKLHSITVSFLDLLLTNKRESYLEIITRNFLSSYREFKGLKSVELTTAYVLDKETIEQFGQVIRKYFNTEAEISCKVNSKLIGGFILRLEDQQIDASVATKIKKLKWELLQSK